MNESLKAVIAFLIIIGVSAIVVLWFVPIQPYLPGVIGAAAVTLASIGVLAWASFRADLAPDYLRVVSDGRYLESSGLCFSIFTAAADGRCTVTIYYQNRHEREGLTKLTLRMAPGFFGRGGSKPLSIEIPFEGGEFGVLHAPWGIPRKFQGKRWKIEIGATTTYPQGRGRLLRYRSGERVGTMSMKPLLAIASILGGLVGALALVQTGSLKLKLPKDVEAEIDPDQQPWSLTLWLPDEPWRPLDELLAATRESQPERVSAACGSSESP